MLYRSYIGTQRKYNTHTHTHTHTYTHTHHPQDWPMYNPTNTYITKLDHTSLLGPIYHPTGSYITPKSRINHPTSPNWCIDHHTTPAVYLSMCSRYPGSEIKNNSCLQLLVYSITEAPPPPHDHKGGNYSTASALKPQLVHTS